ncbi:hypothetical protein L21SP2_0674 [Salinispira pacifica]|uniref:Uncharacterized protein n=1 Tax=Salinispira pacifica TaxID=1307761 RepID=V5WG14_9SPIO|nr:hypothetical protein L21SP2_0674 [Salinispira pacifica]
MDMKMAKVGKSLKVRKKKSVQRSRIKARRWPSLFHKMP